MKKANIILSAIGLLSVIGGALAFKAQHRFSGNLACYTGTAPSSAGHKLTNLIYTTQGISLTSPTLSCTVPTGTQPYISRQVTVNL